MDCGSKSHPCLQNEEIEIQRHDLDHDMCYDDHSPIIGNRISISEFQLTPKLLSKQNYMKNKVSDNPCVTPKYQNLSPILPQKPAKGKRICFKVTGKSHKKLEYGEAQIPLNKGSGAKKNRAPKHLVLHSNGNKMKSRKVSPSIELVVHSPSASSASSMSEGSSVSVPLASMRKCSVGVSGPQSALGIDSPNVFTSTPNEDYADMELDWEEVSSISDKSDSSVPLGRQRNSRFCFSSDILLSSQGSDSNGDEKRNDALYKIDDFSGSDKENIDPVLNSRFRRYIELKNPLSQPLMKLKRKIEVESSCYSQPASCLSSDVPEFTKQWKKMKIDGGLDYEESKEKEIEELFDSPMELSSLEDDFGRIRRRSSTIEEGFFRNFYSCKSLSSTF